LVELFWRHERHLLANVGRGETRGISRYAAFYATLRVVKSFFRRQRGRGKCGRNHSAVKYAMLAVSFKFNRFIWEYFWSF